MRYVYMVRCADNSLYTGITTDLEKRVHDHNNSPTGAKYTRARRPVELVWSQEVGDKSEASKVERELKGLTKAEKENFI